MTLSNDLSEADHSQPQAGHQKMGIQQDAHFLVPVTGLDALRALGASRRRRNPPLADRIEVGITITKERRPAGGVFLWCR